MKIVLYEKDTIIVNIICITVDIIGICCVDKVGWQAYLPLRFLVCLIYYTNIGYIRKIKS